MMNLGLLPIEEEVKPFRSTSSSFSLCKRPPVAQTQEQRAAVYASLRKAALVVRELFVPDEFRVALWAHPQFAAWRAELPQDHRRGGDIPLSLLAALGFIVKWLFYPSQDDRFSEKGSGWQWLHWVELAALMGFPRNPHTGEFLLEIVEQFAKVGLTLEVKGWSRNAKRSRACRLTGFPPELVAYFSDFDPLAMERPALLHMLHSPSDLMVERRRAALRRKFQADAAHKAQAQVEAMRAASPLRAQRAEALNAQMPDLSDTLRDRLGQALVVAQSLGNEGLEKRLRKIAAVGVPYVGGRARSRSTRLGGELALGQLPTKVLRELVPHTVELDLVSAAPSVAAAMSIRRRPRKFFAACQRKGLHPVEELAKLALSKCVPPSGSNINLREPRYVRAATKALKHMLAVGLCGGQVGEGPLMVDYEVGGKTHKLKIAAFRHHALRLAIVRDLLDGFWGDKGFGTLLRHYGAVLTHCTTISADVSSGDARKVAENVRSAVAQKFGFFEGRIVLAAIKAASAHADTFDIIADKHDGLVLRRKDPSKRGEQALAAICAAARAEAARFDIYTDLRVKYDADFGGELACESGSAVVRMTGAKAAGLA